MYINIIYMKMLNVPNRYKISYFLLLEFLSVEIVIDIFGDIIILLLMYVNASGRIRPKTVFLSG